MSSLGKNNKHPTNIVPCLDLHGYRKSSAVASFTSFIELQQTRRAVPRWVHIVTGTGQHSADGPVLRGAIQRLLEKRCMEYSYDKRGVFVVNANSGFELRKGEENVDTKIQVVSAENQQRSLVGRLPKCNNDSTCTIDNTAQPSTFALQTNAAQHDPLPHQVAQDDAQLKEAKLKSVSEFNQDRKLQNEEERKMARALSESSLLLQHEQLRQTEQEDEMARALSESSRLQTREQEELERALSMSKLHHEEENRECDGQVEQAMLLSQQEQQEEEELLRRAISLSVVDCVESKAIQD